MPGLRIGQFSAVPPGLDRAFAPFDYRPPFGLKLDHREHSQARLAFLLSGVIESESSHLMMHHSERRV